MVDNLPKLAETSATAISNIKFDKVVVWDSGGSGGGGSGEGGGGSPTTATSNFIRGLTSSMPPALDVLRSVGGIDGLDQFLLSGGGNGKEEETLKDQLAQALKEAKDVKEINLSPSKKL